MIRRLLLTLLALAWLGAPAWAQGSVQLRLMETTDIHVNLLNYDYYRDRAEGTFGLALTASLIRQARAEVTNSLLIDNGDSIQGSPLGDFVVRRGLKPGEAHPVYRAFNLLGYDAGNVGNHEFNYGLEFLQAALAGARYPVVSANVFHADGQRNYFTPYVILERKLKDGAGAEHPIKIGIIGFVPPQILQWDRANLEGKVVARDIVETARRFVPEMRAKGADLVVAVPHSGLNPRERQGEDENAAAYLAQVPGIDAVLFGHAHLVFPSDAFKDFPGADVARGTLHGVPAVMPGFWGSHLGIVDLTLERDAAGKWRVADAKASVRPVFRTEGRSRVAAVPADPEVVAAVKAEHEGTLAYVRAPVGKTSAQIYSYFALVQDDPSIQIVTDAQTWYTRRILKGTPHEKLPILSAGAPFKAGGRGGAEYYTDVPAGDIAIKNVADLYLYPNTVQVVELTGAGVKEWLEMAAGIFNQIDPAKGDGQALVNPGFPSFNYDVIDGVTYRIDVTRPRRYDNDGKLVAPDSHRIVDLQFDKKPIDPTQRFVVVTNNYRASGGGKFPGLDGKNIIVEAPDENREALVQYIRETGTVNPSADGNWSFAPTGKGVTVVFDSSPAAETLLAAHPKVSKLGTGENGFIRYGIKLD